MALSNILARLPPIHRDEDARSTPVANPQDANPQDANPHDANLHDAAAEEPAETGPDIKKALTLLDGAADALLAFQKRCEQAEIELNELKTRLTEADRRAQRLDYELYNAELKLKETNSRATMAEDRLMNAERRAVVAEESTLEARNWLNSYYEKIIESFAMPVQAQSSRMAA